MSRSWLLLFGGSFNPPHIGHLRILIETMEVLLPQEALFVPVALPAHKPAKGLLPFSVRCDMLRAALADMHSPMNIAVSQVENEREGPSYTADTLRLLAKAHPDKRLVFLMGSEDYERLPTWHLWRDIPRYADLVVLPRSDAAPERFGAITGAHWPDAAPAPCPCPGVGEAFSLQNGALLMLVPQPVFEVSSTLVRERFLSGKCLDFLVSPGVADYMRTHADLLSACWAG
ncbi:nicotinate (nicotinamide) nucleotide adenylyltransferase [Desulfovibrio sp. OttesenSCG-928-G15]|nr:nicotinate (nicotinamide) nucleotide adenylyltransferase [Desulfovibrio sp. OttesenSCG-928-G15]